MCTHISAFRTARNLKTVALHHLTRLPAGYFKRVGSGKIHRLIDDGAGQTETYLAHQLPDLVESVEKKTGNATIADQVKKRREDNYECSLHGNQRQPGVCREKESGGDNRDTGECLKFNPKR